MAPPPPAQAAPPATDMHSCRQSSYAGLLAHAPVLLPPIPCTGGSKKICKCEWHGTAASSKPWPGVDACAASRTAAVRWQLPPAQLALCMLAPIMTAAGCPLAHCPAPAMRVSLVLALSVCDRPAWGPGGAPAPHAHPPAPHPPAPHAHPPALHTRPARPSSSLPPNSIVPPPRLARAAPLDHHLRNQCVPA